MTTKTNALPTLPSLPSNRTNATRDCRCGCGRSTQSTFAPGHDAILKGLVLRVAMRVMTLDDVTEWGGEARMKAVDRAMLDAPLMKRWDLTDRVAAFFEAEDEARDDAAIG